MNDKELAALTGAADLDDPADRLMLADAHAEAKGMGEWEAVLRRTEIPLARTPYGLVIDFARMAAALEEQPDHSAVRLAMADALETDPHALFPKRRLAEVQRWLAGRRRLGARPPEAELERAAAWYLGSLPRRDRCDAGLLRVAAGFDRELAAWWFQVGDQREHFYGSDRQLVVFSGDELVVGNHLYALPSVRTRAGLEAYEYYEQYE